MNRTITMNLSGIIFHIEEDAYDKLNKYLTTIRSYFKDSDGRDEIMSDIESRIAEMLQEKVSKTKQAVLMMDVESVIAVMGKPEDFAGDAEPSQNTNTNGATAENATHQQTKRRRLFRDPDDKMVGGVCSGIAHYFDFDPIWLRAAFAISFFVFGSGFLLYMILMIIMPKAKTIAEKLEMRGEKVDINNIGKAVNEEFDDLKKRMKNFGSEIGSKETKERVRSSARQATEFAGDVLGHMARVFGKIFAVFLVFFGVVLMVVLLATIFGRGTISIFNSSVNNVHFSLYEFCAAAVPNGIPIELIVTGLILFVGVPLLSIIYRGIKHLFGIKEKNRIVKYTANILWLIGVAIMIYIGCMVGTDFNEETVMKQDVAIQQPLHNTLYLDMKPTTEDDIELTYNHNRHFYLGNWSMMSKDDENFRLGYPELTIVPAEGINYELVVIKSAYGHDKKEAAYRAKNIEYVVTQTDSTILFNSYYDIKTGDKLRAQDLKVLLKVPVGKIVFLSKRMEKIIYNIDNVTNTYDGDMVNRRWIMTVKGLQCVDCNGLERTASQMEDSLVPPPPPLPPGQKRL
ncbi:MAG: hypothetical protein JWP12_3398 [Bacteroidetes bacterium]|nr:hypothetical protein [Bacteroidota bacterium]